MWVCPVTFSFPLFLNGCNLGTVDWCDLKLRKKARDKNAHRLIRLKALSRILTAEPARLGGGRTAADFQKHEDVLHPAALAAQARGPVASVANITYPNAVSERITAALPAIAPIREFLCPPISRCRFQNAGSY
jgi:hypothetical protein